MPSRKKIKTDTGVGDVESTAASVANNRRGVVRRRRGSLQDLPNLAIEIQLEVFRNLHPRDFLNLTRTCKMFRAFFLHPSNEQLWKVARKSVSGIPERPPFLSEPAFIHLLFFPVCHNCGQPNIRKAIWQWFARYCSKCINDVSYDYLSARRILTKVDDSIFDYQDVEGMFGVYQHKGYSYRDARLLKRDVDAFVNALREAPQPITETVGNQLLEQRLEDMSVRKHHVKLCAAWEAKQKRDRAEDLDARRGERFEEILKRLRELGWGKDIDFLNKWSLRQMSELPVVRQSSKLTPKTWKNVLKAVDDFLQRTRRTRLDKENWDLLNPRFIALEQAMLAHYVQLPRTPLMDHRPEYTDLAVMDQCRAIIDVGPLEVVTKVDFAGLMPTLGARWESAMREELTEALLPHLGFVPSEDIDPLTLAIAIFPCTSCSDTPFGFYRYPTILSHPCAHQQFWRYGLKESDDAYYRAAIKVSETIKRLPFALSNMCDADLLGRTVGHMKLIVKLLGLDPTRATADDLQKCEGRMACVDCDLLMHLDKVYAWEASLQHYLNENWVMMCYRSDRKLVARDEMLEKFEADRHVAPTLSVEGSVWACSLCVEWTGCGDNVKTHLSEKHDITYSKECEKNGTIYLHEGQTTVMWRPAFDREAYLWSLAAGDVFD